MSYFTNLLIIGTKKAFNVVVQVSAIINGGTTSPLLPHLLLADWVAIVVYILIQSLIRCFVNCLKLYILYT